MGPIAIYRPFSKLPLTIPRAQGVHFLNRLQPRDQHLATYIMTVPGPLFILSPRDAFSFHIMARYTRALSPLSNICSYIGFSSDIVHFGYLVVLCAGTSSSSLPIIPSGIYTHHWHVVSSTVLHLHFQSHPLILAFRIPIPGSAVLTPPFAPSVL